MQIAKPEVLWLIKENRRTRVMMIFPIVRWLEKYYSMGMLNF